MKLIKIKSWIDFRNIFHEEGLPYEFIVRLNGGLKSSKIFSCLGFSADPKQEIYEIEHLIDDSVEKVSLKKLMTDKTFNINIALNNGALWYQNWEDDY